MYARADNSGGNARRQVAVTDKANAGASGSNIANQFFMPGAIEHYHDEILHVAIHSLRDVLQIVSYRRVELDSILAGGADHDFFHVAVGSVQQPTAFRSGKYGDRTGRARGAKVGAFERIDRNINLGNLAPIRKFRADFLADVKHGRFIALAFADDDGPAH